MRGVAEALLLPLPVLHHSDGDTCRVITTLVVPRVLRVLLWERYADLIGAPDVCRHTTPHHTTPHHTRTAQIFHTCTTLESVGHGGGGMWWNLTAMTCRAEKTIEVIPCCPRPDRVPEDFVAVDLADDNLGSVDREHFRQLVADSPGRVPLSLPRM
jgi:hypothetical protein